MLTKDQYNDFMGRDDKFNWAIGVVEEAGADPLGLGRVKVRWFGIHPEEKSEVPDSALPWAQVLRPATNWQMPALAQGDWVCGFFADGKDAQYPIVIGIINKINRPSRASLPGNGSYIPRVAPFFGQGQENPSRYPGMNPPPNTPGPGAVTGDSRMMLSTDEALAKYAPEHPELQGKGNHIHYGTYQMLVAAERMSSKQTITPHGGSTGKHVSHSMHYQGRAFDLQPGDDNFLRAAVKAGFTGFGFYSWGIHVDSGNARVWGPSYHHDSAPPQKVAILRAAGWHEGKKAFENVATNPGQPANDPSDTALADTANNPDTKYGVTVPGGNSIAPGYANATKGEVANYIADAAIARGIDPNVALTVANNEGLGRYVGDGGSSFGPFQLHYGGIAGGGNSVGGLGDSFTAATNLHASDPNTWKAQVDYSLDYAAKNGWGPWHGWTGDKFAGIGSNASNVPGFHGATYAQNRMGQDSGKPSVAAAARGANIASADTSVTDTGGLDLAHADGPGHPLQDLSGKAYGGLGGFARPGGEEPFHEPISGLMPATYDMVSVFATKSHPSAIVVNDVAGAETILFHHGTTGSKIEMGHDGNDVYRTRKDAYYVAGGNVYHGSSGEYAIGAKGPFKVAAQDAHIQTDGSIMVVSYNDGQFHVQGNFDIHAGQTAQFKATKLIFEAQNVDIFAAQNVTLQAGETFSVRAKTIAMEATDEMNVRTGAKLNMLSKNDMNLVSKQKLNVKTDNDINIKSGTKLFAQTTGDMNLKSGAKLYTQSADDFEIKSAGKIHEQATGAIHVKTNADVLVTSQNTVQVVSNSNLSTPPWDPGGNPADPASDATDASDAANPTTKQDPMEKAIPNAPGNPVVAIRADSTNLGKPSEKTNIVQDKTQNSDPTSLTASLSSVYTV